MSSARLRRRGLLALLAAAAIPAVRRDARAANGGAAAFIQTVGERVVATLQDDALGDDGKLRQLQALMNEATNLDLVARLVMGQYWRQADQAQRREFQRLFRELVVKTMSEQLQNYRGETFTVTGEQALDERDHMVATRITRPGGEPPVAVQWRVRETDNEFLIIDIVAEGISLVVTQRSEVGEVASRRGIDGLLAEMRSRVEGRSTG